MKENAESLRRALKTIKRPRPYLQTLFAWMRRRGRELGIRPVSFRPHQRPS
jgi:hypothetical protein